MARQSKKTNKPLGRSSYKREPYDLVLIVCEGSETEPNYLNNLRETERLSSVNVVVDGDSHSDPVSVVEYAIERYKESNKIYDRVYCLIDRDQHANFNQALQRVKEYNRENNNIITVIRSYPCFEYWYLCHFVYTRQSIRGTGNRTDGDICISLLNPYWRQHIGEQYQKNRSDIYKKIADLTQNAITHSKQALRDATSTDELNPSTEMHTLIEYLLELKNKTSNPVV